MSSSNEDFTIILLKLTKQEILSIPNLTDFELRFMNQLCQDGAFSFFRWSVFTRDIYEEILLERRGEYMECLYYLFDQVQLRIQPYEETNECQQLFQGEIDYI
ncbi:hypothetical protein ABPG72_020556 [Tetrahymena utriculariae]